MFARAIGDKVPLNMWLLIPVSRRESRCYRDCSVARPTNGCAFKSAACCCAASVRVPRYFSFCRARQTTPRNIPREPFSPRAVPYYAVLETHYTAAENIAFTRTRCAPKRLPLRFERSRFFKLSLSHLREKVWPTVIARSVIVEPATMNSRSVNNSRIGNSEIFVERTPAYKRFIKLRGSNRSANRETRDK